MRFRHTTHQVVSVSHEVFLSSQSPKGDQWSPEKLKCILKKRRENAYEKHQTKQTPEHGSGNAETPQAPVRVQPGLRRLSASGVRQDRQVLGVRQEASEAVAPPVPVRVPGGSAQRTPQVGETPGFRQGAGFRSGPVQGRVDAFRGSDRVRTSPRGFRRSPGPARP